MNKQMEKELEKFVDSMSKKEEANLQYFVNSMNKGGTNND